jgi:hypothetical protein
VRISLRRFSRLASGLLVLVLLGLALLGWRRDEQPGPRPPPRPTLVHAFATVVRAVGPGVPDAEALHTGAESPPEVRYDHLTIHVVDPSDGTTLFWPKTARLSPELFWPLPEDGVLPDDPLSDGLEALIQWEVGVGDPLERDWIAAAEEALPPEPADVGTALLALELARRAATLDRDDA